MHVLGMPPAFVLSQDQTLKLIAPTVRAPKGPRSTGTLGASQFIASVSSNPPRRRPEPVSRIRMTNHYADRSTQRRPRIPSILSTFSTAKPAVRAGQATHRAARRRLIWRMHDGCQTRSSSARHFFRNPIPLIGPTRRRSGRQRARSFDAETGKPANAPIYGWKRLQLFG